MGVFKNTGALIQTPDTRARNVRTPAKRTPPTSRNSFMVCGLLAFGPYKLPEVWLHHRGAPMSSVLVVEACTMVRELPQALDRAKIPVSMV